MIRLHRVRPAINRDRRPINVQIPLHQHFVLLHQVPIANRDPLLGIFARSGRGRNRRGGNRRRDQPRRYPPTICGNPVRVPRDRNRRSHPFPAREPLRRVRDARNQFMPEPIERDVPDLLLRVARARLHERLRLAPVPEVQLVVRRDDQQSIDGVEREGRYHSLTLGRPDFASAAQVPYSDLPAEAAGGEDLVR